MPYYLSHNGRYWKRYTPSYRILRTGKNYPWRSLRVNAGRWFDYPECCIAAFDVPLKIDNGKLISHSDFWRKCPVRRRAVSAMQERNELEHIPCIECAKRYLRSRGLATSK